MRIANLRNNPTLPLSTLRPRLLWADNRIGANDLPANAAIRFPIMPEGGNDFQPFLEPPHIETKSIGGSSSGQWDVADTMFYKDSRGSDITARANEIASSLQGLLHPINNPFGATYAGIVPITIYERLTSIQWVSDGESGTVTRFLYQPQEIDWPQLPVHFPGLEGDAKCIIFDLTAGLTAGHGNTATASVVLSSHPSEYPAATAVTVYNTGQMVGLSGARGVAIQFSNQWWVVDLNQPTVLAYFTFTNSTHAAASGGAFGSVAAQQTITFSGFTSLTPYPLNGIVVQPIANPYNLVALSGDAGLCTRNLSTGEYQLIAVHPPKARRFYFKLTADWPSGLQQTATYATAQYPDPINQGGDLNYGTGTITLYDRWNVAHNAKNNNVGLCQLNYATGNFDIIHIEHEMTRGRGDVYATESGTPSTIQVENVVSFDGSIPADDPLELSNELNIESVTEGQKVEIRWNPITGAYYAIPATGGGRVIPVVLEQVGGSQGDNEDPASWTYDVKDFYDTGLVLLEAVNPTSSPHKWKRPSVGQMTEATFGYAHYDAEGELVIGWINEVAEQEACEEA